MTRYLWTGDVWEEARPALEGSLAIIRDGMNPLRHPVSGEMLDSKSAFRAATRAAGCVELGNDVPLGGNRPESGREERKSDIRRAIWELENGRPAPQPGLEGEKSRRYG